MLEKSGNFQQMLFIICSDILMDFILLNGSSFQFKNHFKILEKPGNFISPEMWEPCLRNDITAEVLKVFRR